MKSIAILGATGNIGKSLTNVLVKRPDYELYLYARSMEKLNSFIDDINAKALVNPFLINNFGNHKYDIIINCVGIGNPSEIIGVQNMIYDLTEQYDRLIIEYLKSNSDCIYINMSSGAVYGKSFEIPVNKYSKTRIDINNILPEDYYAIAKLYSECRHRSLPNLNIVDLRIFAFFSRFVDINSGFFISEIIKSIKLKKILLTSKEDIIRDYVSPNDLVDLIIRCAEVKRINTSYDVYSKSPVKKLSLLNYFKSKYGLEYKLDESVNKLSPTGSKHYYYSNNNQAELIGYKPHFTSLDYIKEEMKIIL